MSDYAKSLVKQYDKNGNMMLEGDERKELRGRAAESDLNHDGVITIDELVMHLGAPATAAPATTAASGVALHDSSTDHVRSGSSGYRRHEGDPANSERGKAEADKALAGRVFTGSAGGKGATTKGGDKRRSYRFTPASERPANALPSELKSRDANGDAQVSMSEYSRTWSQSTVASFRRWDLNNDGIITATEAAKKK